MSSKKIKNIQQLYKKINQIRNIKTIDLNFEIIQSCNEEKGIQSLNVKFMPNGKMFYSWINTQKNSFNDASNSLIRDIEDFIFLQHHRKFKIGDKIKVIVEHNINDEYINDPNYNGSLYKEGIIESFNLSHQICKLEGYKYWISACPTKIILLEAVKE